MSLAVVVVLVVATAQNGLKEFAAIAAHGLDAEDDPVDAAMPALADDQGACPADSTPAAGITITSIVRNPDVPSLIHATSRLVSSSATSGSAMPAPRPVAACAIGHPTGSARGAQTMGLHHSGGLNCRRI
ncbi:MAG: hypothetical protein H7337_07180 [Rhizobacter sp.]|nr:hypothetical protein [Rhizobacter sp.]